MARDFDAGYDGTMVMLNRARADLRMRVIGPKNIAVGQGQVFDYFDELRKVLNQRGRRYFLLIHIWTLSLLHGICRMCIPMPQYDC